MRRKRLPRSFFLRDTQSVAKELLGKILVREVDHTLLACRIVEVESYVGHDDRASHASRGRTARNAMMFAPGGHAYVYFIYGMYWCLNVVTERKDYPSAVLIRAGEPLQGITYMQQARRQKAVTNLISGPGKLCQAMQIDRLLNGADVVTSKRLYIVDDGFKVRKADVGQSPRIGVAYAGEHALRPWRYYIASSPYISKG